MTTNNPHHPIHKERKETIIKLLNAGLRNKTIIEKTGLSKNIVNSHISRYKRENKQTFDVSKCNNWII